MRGARSIGIVIAVAGVAAAAHRAARDIDISPRTPSTLVLSSTSTSIAAFPSLGEPARFSEVTARPLFTPTRRPPVVLAAPDPVKPATMPPPRTYQLLGVLLRPKHRSALIASLSEPAGRWITEGGALDDGRLKLVNSDMAVLEFVESTVELRLQPR